MLNEFLGYLQSMLIGGNCLDNAVTILTLMYAWNMNDGFVDRAEIES